MNKSLVFWPGHFSNAASVIRREKRKGGKNNLKSNLKKSTAFLESSTNILCPLSFFLASPPLLTFAQAKQQEGPLMNVADRHGYGSEMQQKAIMVGHSGEKKKREMHLFVRISEQL